MTLSKIELHLLYYSIGVRILFIVLAISSAAFIHSYDTSADLLLEEKLTSAGPRERFLAKYILAPFFRWDSVYFLHLAEAGYLYEQEHAFFPLFPMLMKFSWEKIGLQWFFGSVITSPALGYLLMGFLFCQFCNVLCPMLLYKITLALTRDKKFSRLSSIAYIFAPSNAFLTAIYTESPFAFLAFAGIYRWIKGKNFEAAILFALATLIRSNGIVLAGFFLFSSWKLTTDSFFLPNQGGYTIQGIFKWIRKVVFVDLLSTALVFMSMYSVLSFGYYQYCSQSRASFSELDDGTGYRPWCFNAIPSIYDFVQKEYWNVGFLNYWSVRQLPNFLLALPVIIISSLGISRYARFDSVRFLSLGIFKSDLTDQVKRSSPSPYFNDWNLPFIYMWCFLLFYGTFIMHVQVIIRFFSFVCPFYWFIASLEDNSILSYRTVLTYSFIYSLINMVLYANFYPPA